MESFATPYPLIFTDGDQDVDKGQIGIHSVLSFKRFQAQLSRLIGLPASQLSAVFVCRRTTRDVEKRQKLPINENTNFNIILNQHNPSKERDCHFLVSLKKSKKERKVARKKTAEAENVDDDDSTSSRGDTSPAGERPRPTTEDGYPSPSSVLQQSISMEGESSPEPAPAPAHVDDRQQPQPQLEELPPQLKLPVDDDRPHEQLKVEEQVRVEAKPELEDHVAAVTRIGGQAIQRNGEAAKYGPIGAAPPKLEQQYHQFHDSGTHARFKDAVQPQGVHGRPMLGSGSTVRVNVFNAPGAAAAAIAAFHQQQPPPQGMPNFFQQQNQGRYVNVQPRFIASRSTSSGGDGNGRPMTIHDGGEKFCADCLSYKERNIRSPPFHCCINDRIVTGFRGPSPAGPIERPVKRQVKAAG